MNDPAAGRDEPTPEVVRELLLAWLAGNWDPELSLIEWRGRLVSSGWAVPSYPAQWYGRAWPAWTDELVGAVLAEQGIIGNPKSLAMNLVAGTILFEGPDLMRQRYLERILTGEDTWCQLFSEPGAGSDLAGLTTRADLAGDAWVINGQKVWNTGAQHADLGLLLARTDWDVPKHRGITAFVIPMHQPGVVVRPLRQMNGHTSFNEVFFDDARIPIENVIGEIGRGWPVARTTLQLERRFGVPLTGDPIPADSGRVFDEAQREADLHLAPHAWYRLRSGRPDLLVEHAIAQHVNDDPVIRDEIARVLILQKVGEWTADRHRVRRATGSHSGSEGSIDKLAMSNLARAAARAHLLIARSSALLAGPQAPLDGEVSEVLVSIQAQSIGGGTDEIQRNVIGEKILGLPRDETHDRDLPFRDVPRNG